MQAEFESVWNRLKNIHVNAEGETYNKETSETKDHRTRNNYGLIIHSKEASYRNGASHSVDKWLEKPWESAII